MYTASFDAIGTTFTIKIWNLLSQDQYEVLVEDLRMCAEEFDSLYSRFRSDSLISKLSTCTGVFEVPSDLVAMLRTYELLDSATKGAVNPAIGFALSDTGYNAAYSLREQTVIRDVPKFSDTVLIRDDTHVELLQHALLDLGALGKGYLVDLLYRRMRESGLSRFLVDGSGDIRYYAQEGEEIVCALEHPENPSMAIGTFKVTGGALCASATNRRVWGNRNHYFDPRTKESPVDIVATWVYADDTALADALSTALFFVSPESLTQFDFEYCIVNKDLQRKNSAGFTAEFFTD